MSKRRGQHIPDEGPSASDIERFGDVTRTCPKCKAELYDDVEICWKCGHALGGSDERAGPKPWVAGVVVLLLVVILGAWVFKLF